MKTPVQQTEEYDGHAQCPPSPDLRKRVSHTVGDFLTTRTVRTLRISASSVSYILRSKLNNSCISFLHFQNIERYIIESVMWPWLHIYTPIVPGSNPAENKNCLKTRIRVELVVKRRMWFAEYSWFFLHLLAPTGT